MADESVDEAFGAGVLGRRRFVTNLFADAELDWRDAERIRFVLDVVMEGLAPSNNPVISPLAWKAIIDTGGLNSPGGATLPERYGCGAADSVDGGARCVHGRRDLAVTPGEVVYRNEVFELIQYTPQTEKVRTVPLLMVPPVINKFYILDIASGRSMVEYLLRQGHQVFAMSWRNPTAAQRSWGCDTYGAAIVDALDTIRGDGLGERPCSGVVLGRHPGGHDGRASECDGRGAAHRQPDVDGDRPGSGAGGRGRGRG